MQLKQKFCNYYAKYIRDEANVFVINPLPTEFVKKLPTEYVPYTAFQVEMSAGNHMIVIMKEQYISHRENLCAVTFEIVGHFNDGEFVSLEKPVNLGMNTHIPLSYFDSE